MKKVLVLALVAVMVFAVCSLTACGVNTYTGECSYESWGTTYGCKVDVTVNGKGVITSVKLWSDEDTGWVRTTSADRWDGTSLGIGYEAAEAAYADYLKLFKGKTVEEVMAIDVEVNALIQVVEDDWSIAGATVSAARIVAAVQDALSQIPADAE